MCIRDRGFIIYDSFAKETYQEFVNDMTAWLADGKIAYKEQIVDGLENAPASLNDVLLGKSFGKVVVKVD